MASVLVIGYGKIGAIKADIWKRLGLEVAVVDNQPHRVALARSKGFAAHSSSQIATAEQLRAVTIADISVPSGMHAKTLRDTLPFLENCRIAVVEKPLVSSFEELEEIVELAAGLRDVRLVVNESYYASEGLRKLKQLIETKQGAHNVTVTFSKNRLPDIRKGRFIDEHLGPYGIEVPHMLACLKYIGVGDTTLLANTWHKNALGERDSEGFVCDITTDRTNIRLVETLGPFGIISSDILVRDPDAQVARSIGVVFADQTQALLEFDPVPGIDRYHSRLTTPEGEQIIRDDHLFTMLSAIARYAEGDTTAWLLLAQTSYPEALVDSRRLLHLHKHATVRNHSVKIHSVA